MNVHVTGFNALWKLNVDTNIGMMPTALFTVGLPATETIAKLR